MIKVVSTEFEEGMNFEIEDDTEDFDVMAMELSAMLRYAYDSLRESAKEGGAQDQSAAVFHHCHIGCDPFCCHGKSQRPERCT